MENKNLDQILMGWEGVGGTKLRKKDGNGEECDFSDKCFKVSWGKKKSPVSFWFLWFRNFMCYSKFCRQSDTRAGFGAC